MNWDDLFAVVGIATQKRVDPARQKFKESLRRNAEATEALTESVHKAVTVRDRRKTRRG